MPSGGQSDARENCSTGSTGCVPTALLTEGSAAADKPAKWHNPACLHARTHAGRHARFLISETADPMRKENPPRTPTHFTCGRAGKRQCTGLPSCSISHFQPCLGCISAIKPASACVSLRTYVHYKCSPHQSRPTPNCNYSVHLSLGSIQLDFNGELQTWWEPFKCTWGARYKCT